jgi:hypothetical protein
MQTLNDHQFVDDEGKVWTEITGLSFEQALAFHEMIHQSESPESRMTYLDSLESDLRESGFFDLDETTSDEHPFMDETEADHEALIPF